MPTVENVFHLIHILLCGEAMPWASSWREKTNEVEIPDGSNDTLDII